MTDPAFLHDPRFCHIHQEFCESPIQTRRSVTGLIQTACVDAWTKPIVIEQRDSPVVIDLDIWPTVLDGR